MAGFVLAVLSFFLLLPTPERDTAETDPSFVIGNVRIFDGENLLEDKQIRVADGMIQAIETEGHGKGETRYVDGEGGFLMPGLIDSHAHVFDQAREDALRFGVTTLIDLFSHHQQLPDFRNQRERRGPTRQADVWSAGTLVTAPGGHGTQFGLSIPTLADAEQAEPFVAERLAEGSDFIKLVYESGEAHGLTMKRLPETALRSAIDAARDRGALTVVHAGSREEARTAVAAGAHGLAHLFADAPVDDPLMKALVQGDSFVIPTLTVTASLLDRDAGQDLLSDPETGDRLSKTQEGSLKAGYPALDSPGRYAHMETSVRALAEAGVTLLAGSDAPNPGTAHGASLHEELQRLVAAGLAPDQALSAATAAPAEAFRLPDRGRIASGYRADLLLIQGNPLTNIRDTRRIQRVWKNGHEVALTRDRGSATSPAERPAPPKQADGRTLVSDFESDLSAAFGQAWVVSDDQRMGGQSEVDLTIGREDGEGFMRVSGDIRDGFQWPYAGALWFPGHRPMAPVDLSDYDGLAIRLRGQQASLRMLLFSTANPSGMPLNATLSLSEEWTWQTINFDQFAGADTAAITGIGLFAGPETGHFRFDLAEVILIPAEETP